MKMIASTKVTKAQRAMEQARVFGQSSVGTFRMLKFLDGSSLRDFLSFLQLGKSKPPFSIFGPH